MTGQDKLSALVRHILAARPFDLVGLLQLKRSEDSENGGACNRRFLSLYSNGLNLYHEIHGAGEPLILLHVCVGGIEMFGPNLPALAKDRQVIAPGQVSHRKTTT